MARKIKIPANIPADAFGFIAVRHDRPERRALYTRAGVLQATFAQDADDAEIAAALAPAGYQLDGAFVVAR